MQREEAHQHTIPRDIDQELPINFERMVAEGRMVIEQLAGNQWTNYNPSDPGITMLETLCFGLLDQGYKKQFPLEDILTERNGRLKTSDRFYTPEQIMFTNPVTTHDFRSLLLDRVTDIKNVWIDLLPDQTGKFRVTYELSDDKKRDWFMCSQAKPLIQLNQGLIDIASHLTSLEQLIEQNGLQKELATRGLEHIWYYIKAPSKLGNTPDECAQNLRNALSWLLVTLHVDDKAQTQISTLGRQLLEDLDRIETAYWSIGTLDEYLKDFTSEISSAIDVLLFRHRNLGELFKPAQAILPLKADLAFFTSQVFLKEGAAVENTLAQAIYRLNHYLSPYISFSSYQELVDQGVSFEDIMDGPRLANGYIHREQLIAKRGNVFSSTILNSWIDMDAIERVKGPQPITAYFFKLFFEAQATAGAMFFVDPGSISLDAETVQLVEPSVYLGQQQLPFLNTDKLRQCYRKHRGTRAMAVGMQESERYPELPQGRFRDIRRYHSIQQFMPTFYGLNDTMGLERLAPEQQGQVKQLKAYLMLFEQVLADHQAQLAGMGRLLSFEEEKGATPATYFSQGLYAVPGASDILKAFDSYLEDTQATDANKGRNWFNFQKAQNEYETRLNELQAGADQQLDRKEKILSHLLARVGESLDTAGIISLNPNYGDYRLARLDMARELLKSYPVISENISRSYFNPHPEKTLVAGLEMKLGHSLGINHYYRGLLDLLRGYLGNADEKFLSIDWSGKLKDQLCISYQKRTILRLDPGLAPFNLNLEITQMEDAEAESEKEGSHAFRVSGKQILSNIHMPDFQWSVVYDHATHPLTISFRPESNELLIDGLQDTAEGLHWQNGDNEVKCIPLQTQKANTGKQLFKAKVSLLFSFEELMNYVRLSGWHLYSADSPAETQKHWLLARFARVLEKVMAETEGFVLIDEMVLNEALFDQTAEGELITNRPNVWVCLPREVMQVAGDHFAGLLNKQLLKDGPMTVSYKLCQIDQEQMDQLLLYRKAWLEGIMGLQKLAPQTQLPAAKGAVQPIRDLLNGAKPIKPMVA